MFFALILSCLVVLCFEVLVRFCLCWLLCGGGCGFWCWRFWGFFFCLGLVFFLVLCVAVYCCF